MTDLQFVELIQLIRQIGGFIFGCLLAVIASVTWKG
jgi:hypothetical protein